MNSKQYIENVTALNADERIVTLLEIYHPNLPIRIRVNDDVEDVELFGHTWLGFPFEYTLPSDQDRQLSAGTISIANIGSVPLDGGDRPPKTISQWIDEADAGRGVRIRLMQTLLSDPQIEVDIDFELAGLTIDKNKISGQIKVGTNSLHNNAVAMHFTPENAAGIF